MPTLPVPWRSNLEGECGDDRVRRAQHRRKIGSRVSGLGPPDPGAAGESAREPRRSEPSLTPRPVSQWGAGTCTVLRMHDDLHRGVVVIYEGIETFRDQGVDRDATGDEWLEVDEVVLNELDRGRVVAHVGDRAVQVDLFENEFFACRGPQAYPRSTRSR